MLSAQVIRMIASIDSGRSSSFRRRLFDPERHSRHILGAAANRSAACANVHDGHSGKIQAS
jgi:hypothetical protein